MYREKHYTNKPLNILSRAERKRKMFYSI